MEVTERLRTLLASAHPPEVIVVGAGLAGSECAWQLAQAGHQVALLEQRPERTSEAHTGPLFAELVCSNSLKSTDPESAPNVLKSELTRLNSLILRCARLHAVPAGQALAVEREGFAKAVTEALQTHPRVHVLRVGVDHVEEVLIGSASGQIPVVLATGPLTAPSLAQSLQKVIGTSLYFYDAIAPIVAGESINREIAFAQNRYDKVSADGSNDDYLNCPFSKEQYFAFIEALRAAEKVPAHEFEKEIYFQGCQPIEAMVERGPMTLAFGPMKPMGITDPRTGQRPFAVLQLRKEDSEGRAWNLVGFQTKLKYPEQQRIFRMIPGLEKAEFYRLGSVHRNTYINAPSLLDNNFRLKALPTLHFAGQVTGVEGYLESCAIGALVGRMLSMRLRGLGNAVPPPATTALGALAHGTFGGRAKDYQPFNINWGLVPLMDINERDKEKRPKMVARAERHFGHWLALS